jgi:hypothetical protein
MSTLGGLLYITWKVLYLQLRLAFRIVFENLLLFSSLVMDGLEGIHI